MRIERDFQAAIPGVNGTTSADVTALKNEVNRLQLELTRSRATPAASTVYM